MTRARVVCGVCGEAVAGPSCAGHTCPACGALLRDLWEADHPDGPDAARGAGEAAIRAEFAEAGLPAPTAIPCAGRDHRLTPTQRRVLAALCEEGTRAAAAARLGLSVSTVKNHLTVVYAALRVPNGVIACREYWRSGGGREEGR